MIILSTELLTELQSLSRADKLRAVQFLVNELAVEEEALMAPGAHYEIWSPYDAPAAAQTQLDLLAADKRSPDA